jgi:hypothetical protein
MLAAAARSTDWDRAVIHRCAWCSRVADPQTVYQPARAPLALGATTDGMCPDCWVDALQRLAARKRHKVALPAA